MKKPRRILIGLIVFALCAVFVIQPGPSAPVSNWHVRWPKIHLPFDASTPFRAVASIVTDVPKAFIAAGKYVGTAIGGGIHSLFTPDSSPASTTTDYPMGGAVENT